MRPIAVVLLAAGKGTRMKSETAKVLHEICGRPMIAYPVELAKKLKPKKTVVIVGHQAKQVKQTIGDHFPKAKVDFALQKTQDGTGHAVLQAKRALKGFDGDVLILSGDVPLIRAEMLREFVLIHRRSGADLSLLTTMMDDPTGYGRCMVDDHSNLLGIVEEKDANEEQRAITEINTGIYLVDAGLLWQALNEIGKDNAQGEMYLTDIVHIAAAQNKLVRAVLTSAADEVMGVNSRVELAEAAEIIRFRLLGQLMVDGVTIIDPATAYLDYGVKVGRDSLLEPCVMLAGKTKVGEGCRIGMGCRLENVTLGKNVTLSPYTVLSNKRIKTGTVI